jgi:hypothetical protein
MNKTTIFKKIKRKGEQTMKLKKNEDSNVKNTEGVENVEVANQPDASMENVVKELMGQSVPEIFFDFKNLKVSIFIHFDQLPEMVKDSSITQLIEMLKDSNLTGDSEMVKDSSITKFVEMVKDSSITQLMEMVAASGGFRIEVGLLDRTMRIGPLS